jgi:hypothetical protein
MRIRRIIAGLLRKVATPSFLHEAATCREKAEAMRTRYGPLATSSRPLRRRPASLGAGVVVASSHSVSQASARINDRR